LNACFSCIDNYDEIEIVHGDQIKEIEDPESKLSEPVGWIVSFRLSMEDSDLAAVVSIHFLLLHAWWVVIW
jgi:hypothetical protein